MGDSVAEDRGTGTKKKKRKMLNCGMLERDSRALRKRSIVLCKQLVVDELLIQCLEANNILTPGMAEGILAKNTSHERTWQLLKLLPKRGPEAFSSFCLALRETEQQHLCDLLTQPPDRDDHETQGERLIDSSFQHPIQEAVPAKRQRIEDLTECSLDADGPIDTPVQPCTHEFYLNHYQQSYRMSSSPRGFALVISNVNFDASTGLDARKGGEVDEEVLRKVFTELDYQTIVHRNLTAQDMAKCIEDLARRPEHENMDSLVVCLLSHGTDGAVYGTDAEPLQLDWVFKAFDNSGCPLLQNKAKMFFIQACRGETRDCGVEQVDGPTRTSSPNCEQQDAGREGEETGDPRQSGDSPRIKLPQRSDMICGFASLKGHCAMRNTKKGSWYIQELNRALRLHSKDVHLADILVKVNNRIKQREGYCPGTPYHRCKEMSEFTTSLCQSIFLFPKHQVPQD